MGTDPITTTIATGAGIGAASGGGIQDISNGIFGGKPTPPPAPDYIGAANATAAGNLANAQDAAAANRPNQTTTYGNLTWSQTGTDAQGNPIWSVNQSLSPEQQQIYQGQSQLSQGALGTANNWMNNLSGTTGQVDMSKLPGYGINPGQNYADAMMQQLQPQLQRDQASLNQQLANQGIGIGSEAYNTAQQQQSDAANRARLQAITGGMNTGLAANNQAFNQAATNQQMPVNLINALRSGSQVQNPNFVNLNASQATTPGADIMGATQSLGNYNNNVYNQQVAQQNAMTSGLFGLGGAGLIAASDIRVKQNIKFKGKTEKGFNVYEFEYKPEFKDIAGYGKFIGVMAQEVEKVKPEAVSYHVNGYKMVNYAMVV